MVLPQSKNTGTGTAELAATFLLSHEGDGFFPHNRDRKTEILHKEM